MKDTHNGEWRIACVHHLFHIYAYCTHSAKFTTCVSQRIANNERESVGEGIDAPYRVKIGEKATREFTHYCILCSDGMTNSAKIRATRSEAERERQREKKTLCASDVTLNSFVNATDATDIVDTHHTRHRDAFYSFVCHTPRVCLPAVCLFVFVGTKFEICHFCLSIGNVCTRRSVHPDGSREKECENKTWWSNRHHPYFTAVKSYLMNILHAAAFFPFCHSFARASASLMQRCRVQTLNNERWTWSTHSYYLWSYGFIH